VTFASKPWALAGKAVPTAEDGWLRLVGGVVGQAVEDLGSPDPMKSLDALIFVLTDAPTFLAVLGYDLAPDAIFLRAVKKARKRYD